MRARVWRGYGADMAPARFVTDLSLEGLARRLRFLGYDIVTQRGARLEDLFESARRDQRIVLTLSARHPRRFADVSALRVPRENPAAALRAITAGHEASGPPFSRCPECNSVLQQRLAVEARGEVPARVTRGAETLSYCPTCGKWYWEGSHTARLREALAAALGDPDAPSRSGEETSS